MLLAGRDLYTCAGLKDEAVPLHVNGQLSFKNIEELAGTEVEVPDFACAGWHELFDDAEVGCPDEMPAVAVVSLRATPSVVLGRLWADDLRADDLSHRESFQLRASWSLAERFAFRGRGSP